MTVVWIKNWRQRDRFLLMNIERMKEKQTIEDRRWSYGSIQKAKVRTRHLQLHSVFHTCVPVQPHGRAGGLFRDFLFLPVGGKNEQMESVGTVTGNGGGLGFA